LVSADPPKKLEPQNHEPLPLPRVLRQFWAGSLLMFVAMIVLGYVLYRLGYPQPHYNPLGGARYEDLMEYLPTYKFLHTAAFFRNPYTSAVAYPPLGAVLYALVYSFANPIAFYLTTAAVGLAAAVWGVRRALISHGIAPWTATLFPLTIVLVSFPIAGLLQRGNIEVFLWIFAAAGSWAYIEGYDDVAAILWALAAASKLYPVIFFALLLPRRKYRALAVGIVTFVAASLLSMEWLGPSIAVAWKGSLANVFGYQGVRVAQWNLHEIAANHSVFGLAKLAAMVFGFPLAKLPMPYYALGALVFAAFFFGRIAKLSAANQLLAVSTFMVMLPPVSYFYALVHLYAPLVVLVFVAVRTSRAGVRVPGLTVTVLLFVPLCASFMLFTFPKVYLFGGLVQACLLILLFLCSAMFPFAVPVSGAENARPATEASLR
jgi:Glycosyltransferase family 87